jgi:hypothetical protein
MSDHYFSQPPTPILEPLPASTPPPPAPTTKYIDIFDDLDPFEFEDIHASPKEDIECTVVNYSEPEACESERRLEHEAAEMESDEEYIFPVDGSREEFGGYDYNLSEASQSKLSVGMRTPGLSWSFSSASTTEFEEGLDELEASWRALRVRLLVMVPASFSLTIENRSVKEDYACIWDQ